MTRSWTRNRAEGWVIPPFLDGFASASIASLGQSAKHTNVIKIVPINSADRTVPVWLGSPTTAVLDPSGHRVESDPKRSGVRLGEVEVPSIRPTTPIDTIMVTSPLPIRGWIGWRRG